MFLSHFVYLCKLKKQINKKKIRRENFRLSETTFTEWQMADRMADRMAYGDKQKLTNKSF